LSLHAECSSNTEVKAVGYYQVRRPSLPIPPPPASAAYLHKFAPTFYYLDTAEVLPAFWALLPVAVKKIKYNYNWQTLGGSVWQNNLISLALLCIVIIFDA
jgi:hypothetical protein